MSNPTPCRAKGCGSPLEMSPDAKDGVCADCIVDGFCPKRADESHCEHWQDGLPCCDCGFNGPDDPGDQ